uniref:TNF receptor superfamily member 18 n=1 Tax=Sus scrofa TaxID=9823 RepID=A0A8D0ZY38_PIG
MTRTRRDGAQPLPCPKSSAPDLHFELQGLGGPPREPLLGAPGAWQRRGAGRGLGASSGGWPPQVPEERCAALGAAGAMGARGVRLALCGFALLCALGLGQRPAGRSSCGAGRLLRGTGTNARCCRSCARGKEGPGAPARRSSGAAPPPRAQRKLSGSRALPGGLKAPSSGQGPGRCAEAGKAEGVCPETDCECIQPEFHCGDPQCKSCKRYSCPPGQEAQPEGNFNFGFKCVDCVAGTFSGGHEGHCKPWADCSQFGFLTTFPGNKTHNAVCSPGPPPAEPHSLLTVLLLAVATGILVLTVTQLSLHVWQLRRQRAWPPGQLCPGEGAGAPGPPADHNPFAETQLLLEAPPPPPEDACSIQFPEEERGERLSENKARLGDLWV